MLITRCKVTWQKRYQTVYNINFMMRVTIITTNENCGDQLVRNKFKTMVSG